MMILYLQVNTLVYQVVGNCILMQLVEPHKFPVRVPRKGKDQHVNTDINAIFHLGAGISTLEAMREVNQEITVALRVVPT